jgi:hypothetical protein
MDYRLSSLQRLPTKKKDMTTQTTGASNFLMWRAGISVLVFGAVGGALQANP